MIICGYPCIGKSTLAAKDPLFIDLESSYFKIPGRDNTGWEQNYCDLALQLYRQGHHVFVSSHADVVNYMIAVWENPANMFSEQDLKICYPDLSLYDIWVQRAQRRYEEHWLEKNRLAMERIMKFWNSDLEALAKHDKYTAVIPSDLYDLKEILLG